jgi:energy-coupling factor transporter ATP-binding protein EcfA2
LLALLDLADECLEEKIMRIQNLVLDEAPVKVGLKPIRMERLGQIVALFGPNGAGKSRILRLVQNQASEDSQALSVKPDLPARIEQAKEVYLMRATQYKGIKDRVPVSPQLPSLANVVQRTKDTFDKLTRLSEHIERLYGKDYIRPFPIVSLQLTAGSDSVSSDSIRAIVAQVTGQAPLRLFFGHNTMSFLSALASAKYENENPLSNRQQVDPLVTLFTQAEQLIADLMHMKFGFAP